MASDPAVIALSRFTAFGPLSPLEVRHLAELAGITRSLKRGEHVYHEDDVPSGLSLLLRGWTASSVLFENGSRQLTKVHLPGDMLGLPNLAFRETADSVVALTPVEIGIVSPAALGRLFEVNPRLAAVLFLISQQERVAGMDRLASVAATSAISRVAALIRELHARLARTDPNVSDMIEVPLLQQDVADLVGITAVHLNRTIQTLRSYGIVRWNRRQLTILDGDRLAVLAGLPDRVLDTDPSWLPAATDVTPLGADGDADSSGRSRQSRQV